MLSPCLLGDPTSPHSTQESIPPREFRSRERWVCKGTFRNSELPSLEFYYLETIAESRRVVERGWTDGGMDNPEGDRLLVLLRSNRLRRQELRESSTDLFIIRLLSHGERAQNPFPLKSSASQGSGINFAESSGEEDRRVREGASKGQGTGLVFTSWWRDPTSPCFRRNDRTGSPYRPLRQPPLSPARFEIRVGKAGTRCLRAREIFVDGKTRGVKRRLSCGQEGSRTI